MKPSIKSIVLKALTALMMLILGVSYWHEKGWRSDLFLLVGILTVISTIMMIRQRRRINKGVHP